MKKMETAMSVTKENVEKMGQSLEEKFNTAGHQLDRSVQDIICPECGHEFKATLNPIPKL